MEVRRGGRRLEIYGTNEKIEKPAARAPPLLKQPWPLVLVGRGSIFLDIGGKHTQDNPFKNWGAEYFGMSVEERVAFYTLDRVSGLVKSGEVSLPDFDSTLQL